MFTTRYKSVEIIAPEKRYVALIQEWFDGLEDGEVKEAICRLQWQELRPKASWFWLSVTCRHQQPEDIEAFKKAKQQDDVSIIENAAMKVITPFNEWIERSGAPRESIVDERSARICWLADGITYHDPENFSPQEKAQFEINRQASMYLSLVHVSSQPEADLVKSMVGSNTPFACAGLMLGGRVRVIRSFPPNFPENERETERLHENLWEYPADFVTLMRLAHHFGVGQNVVKKAKAATNRFLSTNAQILPDWLKEYEKAEAEEDDPFCSTEVVLDPEFHEVLDAACENYREELLSAITGHELDLVEALNLLLAELPEPHGPMADRLGDEGEWWKRGEE